MWTMSLGFCRVFTSLLIADTIQHLMDTDPCPVETLISGTCGWAGSRGPRCLRTGIPQGEGAYLRAGQNGGAVSGQDKLM